MSVSTAWSWRARQPPRRQPRPAPTAARRSTTTAGPGPAACAAPPTNSRSRTVDFHSHAGAEAARREPRNQFAPPGLSSNFMPANAAGWRVASRARARAMVVISTVATRTVARSKTKSRARWDSMPSPVASSTEAIGLMRLARPSAQASPGASTSRSIGSFGAMLADHRARYFDRRRTLLVIAGV